MKDLGSKLTLDAIATAGFGIQTNSFTGMYTQVCFLIYIYVCLSSVYLSVYLAVFIFFVCLYIYLCFHLYGFFLSIFNLKRHPCNWFKNDVKRRKNGGTYPKLKEKTTEIWVAVTHSILSPYICIYLSIYLQGVC